MPLWPDLHRASAPVAPRLAALRGKPLNYDPAHIGGAGWGHDDYRQPLPPEPPGEPVSGGSFRAACQLSRDYAFVSPTLVEAHFDRDAPLEGRDMLLILKAVGLRLDAGVRVAGVEEKHCDWEGGPAVLFTWNYRTLEGHIEAGQRDFEVWKRLDTGAVEFRTHSVSKPAAGNLFVLAGYKVIGHHKQAEFGEVACARMLDLTRAATAAAV